MDAGDGERVRVFEVGTFIATKIAAFDSRGAGDWYGSHDIEDVVALIEGRRALVDEVSAAPSDARGFVASWSRRLLKQASPRDIVEGHLSREALRSGMLPEILRRVNALSRLGT